MIRPDWNTYFLRIAQEISSRATCPRASVGAVIVKNNRILSSGYNGSASGEQHCVDVGCDVVDDHCQRAIHAEVNAVAEAAKFGVAIDGATLYFYDSLHRPESCNNCLQAMKAAGIRRLVYMSGEEVQDIVIQKG